MGEEGESWALRVEDDGIGIAEPGSPAPQSGAKEPGIGTELVHALSGQLRGDLTRGPACLSASGSPSSGPGTLVTMRFPRERDRPSASGRL
jgi:two-component sensor histidine kinase